MAVTINFFGDFRAETPSVIKFDGEVKRLLNKADLNVCNFEAPVVTDGAKAIKKSGPSLYQSKDAPAFLIHNGFNIILLANNHIMDYDRAGCAETIRMFDNVKTVGAGYASDAYAIRIVEIKDKKIGFLSLVQNEFGIIESRNDNEYGCAWINSYDVQDIIKEGRNTCDVLIVCPHAGVEHTAAPLPEWRRLYRKIIDWGADAIIAGHPHCPQGWEDYNGKRIYYSLGNFYFDGLTYDDLWYKSISVEMTINSDNTMHFQEHFVKFEKTGNVVLDHSNEIKEWAVFINRLLRNDNQYNSYINELCDHLYKEMRYILLRGVCGFSLKVKLKYAIRLLGCMLIGDSDEISMNNVIRCESHRWVIQRALDKYYRYNNR